MGTSVNQRSPETPNWKIAQRAYENPDIPMDRALREVWRAADNQPEGNLAAQLSDPFIGSLATVATSANSPAAASREAGDRIVDNKAASLGAEIAKRAAMQAAGKQNPQEV